MSKTFLCWHLPDGSPERGEEVIATTPEDAAVAFGKSFFDDNEGEWLGGHVMVQPLDANLDGIGEAVRFDIDIDLTKEDVIVTATREP